MKQLLITIAAVVLVGCGPGGNLPSLAHTIKDGRQDLEYAIDYFGNYGPYYIYLLGPDNDKALEASI